MTTSIQEQSLHKMPQFVPSDETDEKTDETDELMMMAIRNVA